MQAILFSGSRHCRPRSDGVLQETPPAPPWLTTNSIVAPPYRYVNTILLDKSNNYVHIDMFREVRNNNNVVNQKSGGRYAI